MKFLKLLKKNKTVEPATYDAVYGSMVEKKIRMRYSLSAELAILRQRDALNQVGHLQHFVDLGKAHTDVIAQLYRFDVRHLARSLLSCKFLLRFPGGAKQFG